MYLIRSSPYVTRSAPSQSVNDRCDHDERRIEIGEERVSRAGFPLRSSSPSIRLAGWAKTHQRLLLPGEILTGCCSRGLSATSTSATPPVFPLGNILRGAPHLEHCWSGLYFSAHPMYRTPQLMYIAVGIVITNLLPHLKDCRARKERPLQRRSGQAVMMR